MVVSLMFSVGVSDCRVLIAPVLRLRKSVYFIQPSLTAEQCFIGSSQDTKWGPAEFSCHERTRILTALSDVSPGSFDKGDYSVPGFLT